MGDKVRVSVRVDYGTHGYSVEANTTQRAMSEVERREMVDAMIDEAARAAKQRGRPRRGPIRWRI